MTMPDVSGLPTDLDITYGDDAANPGRKLHQQHHDTLHGFAKAANATYVAAAKAPTGVAATDTANLLAAADSLPGGKGRVILRPGTYFAQGLPLREGLYWEGAGENSTTVRLPASPTAHLFVAPTVTSFTGGGVSNMTLFGGSTAVYDSTVAFDGINFEGVSNFLHGFHIEHVFIHGFRTGYRGAQRDRDPWLIAVRIWNCTTGVYIRSEHPHLIGFDIRFCDTGIGGTIYDAQFTHGRLVLNRYGMRALDGGNISHSAFTSVWFADNAEAGAIVDDENSFDKSCYFRGSVGNPSLLGLSVSIGCKISAQFNRLGVGLILRGTGDQQVDGARFRHCLENAIKYLFPAADPTFPSIRNTKFWHGGTGPVILFDPSGTGASVRLAHIVDNEALITSDVSFFKSTKSLIHGVLDDNSVFYSGATVTAPVFDFAATGGYSFQGNTIWAEVATGNKALVATNSIRSIIEGNRVRSFTAPIFSLGTTDADTRVVNNFGFVTETQGTGVQAAADTTEIVFHGLSRTPNIAGISVTPASSLQSASKFWISNVTDTQFTINTDVAPGANTTWVWQASAARG